MKSHAKLALLLALASLGGCNSDPNRNWAGLDANQRAAMQNLSQHFQQQAEHDRVEYNNRAATYSANIAQQEQENKIRQQQQIIECMQRQVDNPYGNSNSCQPWSTGN